MIGITFENTYQALVDALIPRTPGLAQEYGRIQYYGALDQQVDQFLIYELEHYPESLTTLIARILDAAAIQWRRNQGYFGPISFLMLPPMERLGVLTMLRQEAQSPGYLDRISQDDSLLAIAVILLLDTLTFMGYYSEWYGYGSTRLKSPEERVLEFKPNSWLQVGYPGPSLGYWVLRQVTWEEL